MQIFKLCEVSFAALPDVVPDLVDPLVVVQLVGLPGPGPGTADHHHLVMAAAASRHAVTHSGGGASETNAHRINIFNHHQWKIGNMERGYLNSLQNVERYKMN